ncbi:MAG: heavy metal-binding domain-containing protein [Candidatus Zixiibacteriota bacterium]
MSYPFKRGNWIVVLSLFCFFSFVLMIGAQGALADGKGGCSKTCPHKTAAATCPMMMKASTEGESGGKESGAAQVLTLDSFSKMEQYTCPMHPEVRAEKAAKCPECGMKLVKEDFYEVYRCHMEACPSVSAKADKCCGKDLQKTLMSKDEYYQLTQLQDEYFCPMHPEVVSGEAGKCSQCGMKLGMRIVQLVALESEETPSYACPMHPEIVSDEAGKCSKCGMKLEMKTVQKAEEEPQQAAKYFCSMHPDQMSDKAGICLQCGMKLREKKASTK